jgi:putative DNA methylase
LLKALRWAQQPTDNFAVTDERVFRVDVGESLFPVPGERLLFCRSSENLYPLTDGQAALVITDPPYFGNVMYAELSDFFYVWLRTALQDAYPAVFAAPLTPKDEEIVETVTRGHGAAFLTKDEAFFTGGLTRIFTEAARVLDDDGLLVFTFHHQANEAWASVLKTVLDAGFYVKAFYPVHAEMVSSLHIRDKANISYDALIVCREQHGEPAAANWQDIADRIYLRAERLVKELENGGRDLMPEDIYVIAVGQCLEEYSRHYHRGRSYVTWQGEPVGIAAALDGDEGRDIQGIGAIVDQLVEEAEGRLWPPGLDPISRFYVLNFLGQSEVPYDRLKRRLQHNPHVTFGLLERQQLVRVSGGKVRVIPELSRADYLLAKLGGGDPSESQPALPGFDVDDISALDRLHLLYVLDQRGALTGNLIARWAPNSTFVQLARRVAERLDPEDKRQEVYQRIADALGGRATFRMA